MDQGAEAIFALLRTLELRPTCPLCHSPNGERFFEEGARVYYWCVRCDLRFLDPSCRPAAAEEKERYLQHNNDISDPRYRAFVKPLYDHIVERVPRGSVGLDFGSGTGPVLADMLGEAGYEIRLFDPFFHPDRKNLERKYHFILACEVVEHLFDPRTEFQRVKGLLVDGGLLGLMTALWTPELNFADWYYRRDLTHVAFYSQATFCWIKEQFKFQDVCFSGPRVVSLRA